MGGYRPWADAHIPRHGNQLRQGLQLGNGPVAAAHDYGQGQVTARHGQAPTNPAWGTPLPRHGDGDANVLQSRAPGRPASNQAPELWPQVAYPVFPAAVGFPAPHHSALDSASDTNTLDTGTDFGLRNSDNTGFGSSDTQRRAFWGTNGTPSLAVETGSLVSGQDVRGSEEGSRERSEDMVEMIEDLD